MKFFLTLPLIALLLFFQEKEPPAICIDHLPDRKGAEQRFLILPRLTGFFVYDRETDTPYKITADSSIVRRLYQAYYRDHFPIKYAIIKKQLAELPSLKPAVINVLEWEDHTILVQVELLDYSISENNADTALLKKNIFFKYLPQEQKVADIYTLNPDLDQAFHFWYIYAENGKYYGQGLHKHTDSFAFFSLELDTIKQSFQLKELLPIDLPSSYALRKIPSNFSHNITFKKGFFSFWDHDTLIEMNRRRKIKIPLPQNNLNLLPAGYYRIADITSDENYLYVLYHIQEKKTFSVRFSRDHREVKTIQIDKSNKQGLFGYLDSGNQLLYRSDKEKCLQVELIHYD